MEMGALMNLSGGSEWRLTDRGDLPGGREFPGRGDGQGQKILKEIFLMI